jgi:hypothetical protein
MNSLNNNNNNVDDEISIDLKSNSPLVGFNVSSPNENSKPENFNMKSIAEWGYGRIALIIIILLFLGVNVFTHLGDLLQNLKDFFTPILAKILGTLGYTLTESTKDVTELAAEGAKLGIDVAAGTVESGVNVLQQQLDLKKVNNNEEIISEEEIVEIKNKNKKSNGSHSTEVGTISSSINKALADANEQNVPEPDESDSLTQQSGSGKSGYCYIGQDKGIRSCINVGEDNYCMSGDIFPSMDVCVNPSLRE